MFQVAAPNGDTYPLTEAPFFGPEYLRIIAIGRGGGRPQVGAYDERSGRGGSVYATQIVDDADAMPLNNNAFTRTRGSHTVISGIR